MISACVTCLHNQFIPPISPLNTPGDGLHGCAFIPEQIQKRRLKRYGINLILVFRISKSLTYLTYKLPFLLH